MYKTSEWGDNVISTKEKINTYPPLFNRFLCEGAVGPVFFYENKTSFITLHIMAISSVLFLKYLLPTTSFIN